MLLRNSEWSRTFVDDALAFLGDEAKQVRLPGDAHSITYAEVIAALFSVCELESLKAAALLLCFLCHNDAC